MDSSVGDNVPSRMFFSYSDSQDFPGGSDGKASAYNAGNLGSIPGSGRFPGEGNGNPLQYFLPGKSHGRRSLVQATVYGVAESRARLSDFTHSLTHSDSQRVWNSLLGERSKF